MMEINTCTETTSLYHAIAYYSHLIPVFIIALLSVFVLVKSKFSRISVVFASFTFTFCIWLIADVLIWTGNDYHLVNALWAPLDFINIAFYLFGAQFFYLFARGKKLSLLEKTGFVALLLPAWLITISGNSISGFDQANCEALNNTIITNYKLFIEAVVTLFIVVLGTREWLRGDKKRKRQIGLVSTALVLFFSAFSSTEYIASITGIYEINLYGLFVLPIFVFMMMYAVTDMKIFQIKILGTQILTYTMIILVGSQFFFLENATNQILTLITFVLSLSFGVVLARDARREVAQREQLERLTKELAEKNAKLEELDKVKSQFLSFASHDLKSPMNIIKQFASLILDKTYATPEKITETVAKIKLNAERGIGLVEDFLDFRKIEEGKMEYAFERKNLVALVRDLTEDFKVMAREQKNINVTFVSKQQEIPVLVDVTRFNQVIQNLLSNSLKYTEKGSIDVVITEEQHTALITVHDTGLGIKPEVLATLFEQFHRDPGVAKKINGTGLGLYIAKQIVLGHGGEIWAHSDGLGLGSTFSVRVKKAQ